MRDYIGGSDAHVQAFTQNLATYLDGAPEAYGFTAAIATEYQNLQSQFTTSLGIVDNPATRSPSNYEAKRVRRKALVDMTRSLVRQIQANPLVTSEMKVQLGIPVRDTEPTPKNPPANPPIIEVAAVLGRTAHIRLKDSANSDHRRKPDGAVGASIFSYVGAQPPADINDWKFVGSTSRTSLSIPFPATLEPGTKVWLTAMWVNGKMKSSPAATPASLYLGGGVSTQAA